MIASLSPAVLAVDDVGQLAARRGAGVEDVAVAERDAGELEEGPDLEAERVVVGEAEQLRVGIELDHSAGSGSGASRERPQGGHRAGLVFVALLALRTQLGQHGGQWLVLPLGQLLEQAIHDLGRILGPRGPCRPAGEQHREQRPE